MAKVVDVTQGFLDYMLGQAGPYGFGSGVSSQLNESAPPGFRLMPQ